MENTTQALKSGTFQGSGKGAGGHRGFLRRSGFAALASFLTMAGALAAGEGDAPPGTGGATGPAPVEWLQDYEGARKISAERGLPLLMEIGVEGCPWCKQMETVTLADPRVAAKLRAEWICLKVDGRKNAPLVGALGLRNYPTHVYADPSGKILGSNEGFLEANTFLSALDKAAGSLEVPSWMNGVFQEAQKARAGKEDQRALSLARVIVESGIRGPLADQAKTMVAELEGGMKEPPADKKSPSGGDRGPLAGANSKEVIGNLGGPPSPRDGEKSLATLTSRSSDPGARSGNPAASGAASLLEQMEAERQQGRVAGLLEISERLVARYPESEEAKRAREEAQAIRNDPDKLRLAAEHAADRLAGLYLNLAEAWISQGRPQQGAFYLEKVMVTFPGSRHAEAAQARLAQVQGPPALNSAAR